MLLYAAKHGKNGAPTLVCMIHYESLTVERKMENEKEKRK